MLFPFCIKEKIPFFSDFLFYPFEKTSSAHFPLLTHFVLLLYVCLLFFLKPDRGCHLDFLCSVSLFFYTHIYIYFQHSDFLIYAYGINTHNHAWESYQDKLQKCLFILLFTIDLVSQKHFYSIHLYIIHTYRHISIVIHIIFLYYIFQGYRHGVSLYTYLRNDLV